MTRHAAVFISVLDIIIIFNTFINIVIVKNVYRAQPLVNSFYHTFQAISLSPLKNLHVKNLFFIKANVDVSFN